MKRTEAKSLRAELTLGLNKFYSEEKNTLQDVTDALTAAQRELLELHDTHLSAKVTPCTIVFSGQDEDSVTMSFINYPRFPLEEREFKQGVEYIAGRLMTLLSQNRLVIAYADSTVMYEESDRFDPKIML